MRGERLTVAMGRSPRSPGSDVTHNSDPPATVTARVGLGAVAHSAEKGRPVQRTRPCATHSDRKA